MLERNPLPLPSRTLPTDMVVHQTAPDAQSPGGGGSSAARVTVTVWVSLVPSSAVTVTTITLSPSASEGTVIPSVKSRSAIAVPPRVTALTDAPAWVGVAVSVTVVTALPTSTV